MISAFLHSLSAPTHKHREYRQQLSSSPTMEKDLLSTPQRSWESIVENYGLAAAKLRYGRALISHDSRKDLSPAPPPVFVFTAFKLPRDIAELSVNTHNATRQNKEGSYITIAPWRRFDGQTDRQVSFRSSSLSQSREQNLTRMCLSTKCAPCV